MILESAIINLTSNLDVICQQDGKGISSHETLKTKALSCLINLISNAPKSEYLGLIKSDESEIMLGYLLSILCRLAKNDKSKSIRFLSLETIDVLIDRLSQAHATTSAPNDRCSLVALILALPGVSSVLFKLIISDTKLPKDLMVKYIRVLGKLIVATTSPCDHKVITNSELSPKLIEENMINTCDNLSVRISFMLNYIMSNSSSLHNDIKHETLIICHNILKSTSPELVSKSLKSILRYMAFMSSNLSKFVGLKTEIQLQLMLMTDEIKLKMSNSSSENAELDTIVLTCLFELLDKLETEGLTMLNGERQSELEMLCGLIRLLRQDIITAIMEVTERKDQLLNILIGLSEFSLTQPLLFLTESQVRDNSLQQINDNRVYTIEKRFAHLNEKEVVIINTCCHLIGMTTDWPLLMDIFRNDLGCFSSSNNLYVTLQIIKGCSLRADLSMFDISRFTTQSLDRYREGVSERLTMIHQSEDKIYSADIMIIVIALETIVAFIELNVKSVDESSQTVIQLKNLLCPLLNWCSSSNRAISEASLSALHQISNLYGFDSPKTLIEKNTDYIVDGVTKMLENFACNPEVTNVLATTFKLSTKETFYYFNDVYERAFKVLAKCHQTKMSIPLTLLLYRTVCILSDWKSTTNDQIDKEIFMKGQANIQSIISALDIDKIIHNLCDKTKKVKSINDCMNKMDLTKENQARVTEQIKSGQIDIGEDGYKLPNDTAEVPNLKQERKSDDIVLTEKILKHCIGLMSSDHHETKILALKTATRGLNILRDEENIMLPLVHHIWTPLLNRLNQNYIDHLEENLCAYECLVSMAVNSKDFIKKRALDTIIPRLCIFLESQASKSRGKKEYEPYCMTTAYKCQVRTLTQLGQLAYHTQIAYTSLWLIIRVALNYLDDSQVPSLREAALNTLNYLISLDADCVWFFAKQSGKLDCLDLLAKCFDI